MSGHKHHLVPRHAGGDDSPENITPPISIRLHAAFHLDRWKHVGAPQDKIAALMLIGRITSEEARIAAARLGSKKRIGTKLTTEHVRNVSNALRGLKRKPFSVEHRANLRKTQLGRKRSPEAVAKVIIALTGKPWSEKRRAATPTTKNPQSKKHQHASIGKPWSEKRQAAQRVTPAERAQRRFARAEKELARLLVALEKEKSII